MDAFDNIEDSIRRHEEQLDANVLKQRIKELELRNAPSHQPAMSAVINFGKMTTAGKFCLIVLAAFLIVQLTSALGAFAVMVGASDLLAAQFLFWLAIAGGLVWMIYQLVKNP